MLLTKNPAKSGVLGRRNVLLLGISYPCVPSQMAEHGFPEDVLSYKEPSVEQAVECVRRGILTEMDARDLARCVATEQATNTDVYSVSREIGAQYRKDRHVHCDFNARNFCQTLIRQFGPEIQFSQVILDYYWMPTGWLVTRWAKTLFQQTLPDLVRHQMLTFPSKRKARRRDLSEGPPYDIDEGVVFLPFCAHVCKELVGAIHILSKYYEISFLNKKDLHGHSLWKGTMEIDADVMQTRLGKRLDQEEIYCTFRPKDIYESMEDPHVSKPQVMRVLLAIKNYDDIRMVRLRPLRQHERASVFRERLYMDEIGGFKGLDFELSKRLQREMKKGGKKKYEPAGAIEEEKKEDDTMVVEIKKKSVPSVKKELSPKARKKETSSESETTGTVLEDDDPADVEDGGLFKFYPGPARDLETYTQPLETAAEDEVRVAAMKKAERSKKKKPKDNRQSAGHSSPRKGIVYLPGDDISDQRKTKIPKADVFVKEDTDYLSFNPRCPRDGATVRRSIGANDSDEPIFRELDWTLVQSDSDEDEDEKVAESPDLVNEEDLRVASLMYHSVLKGHRTANHEVDGVQRVARIDAAGSTETVCFAVDPKDSDYEEITGYRLDSAENLSEAIRKEEVPLSAIIEAGRSKFKELMDPKDQAWLVKMSSKVGIIKAKRKEADGSVRELPIDRVRNLKNITLWLFLGRQEEHDPSGCFRVIETRLVNQRSKYTEEAIGKIATEIETELAQQIKCASAKVPKDYKEKAANQDKEMLQAIETFLDLSFPLMDYQDAAFTMISLGRKVEDLSVDVLSWLQSEDDSADPTGDFRLVDRFMDDNSDLSKEQRAQEIARRVTCLRNTLAFLKEVRFDSEAAITSPARKSDLALCYTLSLPTATSRGENNMSRSTKNSQVRQLTEERMTEQGSTSLLDGMDKGGDRNKSRGPGGVVIKNDTPLTDAAASHPPKKTKRRSRSKSQSATNGAKDPESTAIENSRRERIAKSDEEPSGNMESNLRSPNVASSTTDWTAMEDLEASVGTSDTAGKASIGKGKRKSKGSDSLSQTAVVEHSASAKQNGENRKTSNKTKRRLRSSSILENGPSANKKRKRSSDEDGPSANKKRKRSSDDSCLVTTLPTAKAKSVSKSRRKSNKNKAGESGVSLGHVTPQSKNTHVDEAASTKTPRAERPKRASETKKSSRASRSRYQPAETMEQQTSPQQASQQESVLPQGGMDVGSFGQMLPRASEQRNRRPHVVTDILGRINIQPNNQSGFNASLSVQLLHEQSADLCLVMKNYSTYLGIALEEYERWIRSSATAIGVERRRRLERICLWLASDGRIVDSETDRKNFDIIHKSLEGVDPHPPLSLERAHRMEIIYEKLVETMTTDNLAIGSDADLMRNWLDIVESRIRMMVGHLFNNQNAASFSHAGARMVTPREEPSPSHSLIHDGSRRNLPSPQVVSLEPYIARISNSPASFSYRGL